MGLVYLPTFYHQNRPKGGKYTSPMDGMGDEGYEGGIISTHSHTVFF